MVEQTAKKILIPSSATACTVDPPRTPSNNHASMAPSLVHGNNIVRPSPVFPFSSFLLSPHTAVRVVHLSYQSFFDRALAHCILSVVLIDPFHSFRALQKALVGFGPRPYLLPSTSSFSLSTPLFSASTHTSRYDDSLQHRPSVAACQHSFRCPSLQSAWPSPPGSPQIGLFPVWSFPHRWCPD